jgi:hypothetical protein
MHTAALVHSWQLLLHGRHAPLSAKKPEPQTVQVEALRKE